VNIIIISMKIIIKIKIKILLDDDDDDNDIGTASHGTGKDDDYVPITSAAANNDAAPDFDDNPVTLAMLQRHREIFMQRAFPPDMPADEDNLLWCRPQEEHEYIIHVIQNWQYGVNLKQMPPGPAREKLVKFRRKHKGGNKYCQRYHLEDIQVPGEEPRVVIRRMEKGKIGRIVVSRETVFEAIDEWHRRNGHLGQERTWQLASEKYYNCSQPLVKIYCETCFICMHKNPVTRPLKGSRKPILSRSFRDRFQIDLIDFRKLRKRDPFGVLMRWIMTIKDHATGFTHLCALPRKRPSLVAYRLQEVFGIIGYPTIFHTDNGKEFTAKMILRFLRQLNPNILSVTGRPRRPNDQGSVESMNKLVKRVLNSVLAERRLGGEAANWTEVLGTVSATINSQCGRGKNDVPSFTAVYGMPYDHEFSCSKEEARKCWTVPDRLQVRIPQLSLHFFKPFIITSVLTPKFCF